MIFEFVSVSRTKTLNILHFLLKLAPLPSPLILKEKSLTERNHKILKDISERPTYTSGAKLNFMVGNAFKLHIWLPEYCHYQFNKQQTHP